MKIAIIGTVASSILGFRRDLIEALVNRSFVIYAFAVDYDDATRAKVRGMGAIPVDYSFDRVGVSPVSDFVNTCRLSRKLKEISPEIVFSYFAKPVIFGTFAAVFAGIKRRVGMLEGLGYVFTDTQKAVSLKIKVLRKTQVFLYRVAFPFLERIIFLNSDDPVDLIDRYGIRARKISILGGIGVNLENYPFTEAPTSPISFLFIGRLLAEKGINDFIAAAKLVRLQYADIRFIVLGDLSAANPGGLSSEALRQCIDVGLIIHPGHVTNVVEWINSSSVFVLPSYYREGVPRSTQEAMAVGRAVITTHLPGCRETVVDGVNGFLIPPWSPEKLAERMIYFIEHPDQIISMGAASHDMARRKFDSKVANERLLTMLGLK